LMIIRLHRPLAPAGCSKRIATRCARRRSAGGSTVKHTLDRSDKDCSSAVPDQGREVPSRQDYDESRWDAARPEGTSSAPHATTPPPAWSRVLSCLQGYLLDPRPDQTGIGPANTMLGYRRMTYESRAVHSPRSSRRRLWPRRSPARPASGRAVSLAESSARTEPVAMSMVTIAPLLRSAGSCAQYAIS